MVAIREKLAEKLAGYGSFIRVWTVIPKKNFVSIIFRFRVINTFLMLGLIPKPGSVQKTRQILTVNCVMKVTIYLHHKPDKSIKLTFFLTS